jgi:hypothetical protein
VKHRDVTPDQVAAARKVLEQPEAESFGDSQWLERVNARTAASIADWGPERETPIQAFRIGDAALAALPSEVFVEIGIDIKSRSPFQRTLVAELANDCFGYIPTDQAFDEGSYETLESPVAKGTAAAMGDAAVALLARLTT